MIDLAIMWYFADNHELMGLVEATNNNLEGAGNKENWIQVQCMYGRDVYDNTLLGSIVIASQDMGLLTQTICWNHLRWLLDDGSYHH